MHSSSPQLLWQAKTRGGMFGDQAVAAAMTDRIVHHARTRAGQPYRGCAIVSVERILLVPQVSASGSGPGCLPDGRGTGFCASGPGFEDELKYRLNPCDPRAARPGGPRDRVGDPEHWLTPSGPILKDFWVS
jgi:hypothetical protein